MFGAESRDKIGHNRPETAFLAESGQKKDRIMTKIRQLAPKMELFCQYLTALGTETFCHKTKASVAAGYSVKAARTIGSRMMKNPAVQARLAELHSETMNRNHVTSDSVLRNLENDKLLARSKGDYATAVRADELQGKYLAMFSEHLYVSPSDGDSYLLESGLALQARRVAAFILNGSLPALPDGTQRALPAPDEIIDEGEIYPLPGPASDEDSDNYSDDEQSID